MRLQLFTYTCQCCGAVFKAPSLRVFEYGSLLLRNTADNFRMALLPLHDSVGKEVSNLLKLFMGNFEIPQFKQIDVFQSVFGEIACDPDESGFIYQVKDPKCINCSIQEITRYEETDPPEFIESDIPEVTHALWNALSEQAKITRVERILNSRFSKQAKDKNSRSVE